MKNSLIPVCFALTLFVLLNNFVTGQYSDKNEVKTVAEKFIQMFATNSPSSIDKISEFIAQDFIQSSSNGEVYYGKEENLEIFKKNIYEIKTYFETLELDFEITSIKIFSKTAIIFGKIQFIGKLKNNKQTFRRKLLETLILRKYKKTWKITHEHSTKF